MDKWTQDKGRVRKVWGQALNFPKTSQTHFLKIAAILGKFRAWPQTFLTRPLSWVFMSFFLLVGCGQTTPQPPATQWVTITDREGQATYRINIPTHWKVLPTAPHSDTTKPIAEFALEDIRITLHSFPVEALEQRVPPSAQINRWKRQFEEINPALGVMTPQAFSGYSGLLFEGSGLLNKKEMTLLGWILQLAPEHFRSLSHQPNTLQKRADITIKVTGPRDLVAKHYRELFAFARSFELIDEVD